MKKLLIILLLLYALPVWAGEEVWKCFERGDCWIVSEPVLTEPIQLARMNVGIVGGGGGGAAAKSCPGSGTSLLAVTTGTDFYAIADTADHTYSGQGAFDPGANWTVCSIAYDVRTVTGDTQTWQVEIYTMATSTSALGAAPTGTCVSASQAISTTGLKTFTGLSCSFVNGTLHGIALVRTDGQTSASHNLSLFRDGDGTTYSGRQMYWTAAKAFHDYYGNDFNITITGFTP